MPKDIQLLTNVDDEKNIQAMLRYLQDHEKNNDFKGGKIPVTGNSNAQEDAALAVVRKDADIGAGFDHAWNRDRSKENMEALKDRFIAQINRDNKDKHVQFSSKDEDQLLQAQNHAYNEVLRAQYANGVPAGAPELLTKDDKSETGKVIREQVMVNYLERYDGLVVKEDPAYADQARSAVKNLYNKVAGDPTKVKALEAKTLPVVAVTGSESPEQEAAVAKIKKEGSGDDRAVVDRFMGSFNEKNGTHLSSNSEEHVLKAQNAALNDYIASISKSEAKPVEIKPEKGAAQSGEQKTGYVPSAKEIQALLGIFDAPAAEAHRDDVKLQNVPNKKAAGTAAGLVVNK